MRVLVKSVDKYGYRVPGGWWQLQRTGLLRGKALGFTAAPQEVAKVEQASIAARECSKDGSLSRRRLDGGIGERAGVHGSLRRRKRMGVQVSKRDLEGFSLRLRFYGERHQGLWDGVRYAGITWGLG